MTQQQIVARHILQYGSLTRNCAIGMYQITRLAAVVEAMKDKGLPILSEPIYQGKKLVDFKYYYREDFLTRMRALKQAQELLERFGWSKKAR